MFVVKKPKGIPNRTKVLNVVENNSIDSIEIAYPEPNVNKGPNAKKIHNSPIPLRDTNLKGVAV